MPGPFSKWLKPDTNQVRVTPHVSVASYVVDDWRRRANYSLAAGAAGMMFGLAAFGYAFAKERMPSFTITPMIHPSGWGVKTYIDGDDEMLDEAIVCSYLRFTTMMLRQVKPGMEANLKIGTLMFANEARTRVERELNALKWYKERISHMKYREVLAEGMNCNKMTGTNGLYRMAWEERDHGSMGFIPGTHRKREFIYEIGRYKEVPSEVASWNPHGVFVVDYRGVLD